MPQLRERDDDAHRCAECEQRDPVGPCAACEALICADCGVMSKDPSGQRVICASCARLVAYVNTRGPTRERTGLKFIALATLAIVGAGVLSLLL